MRKELELIEKIDSYLSKTMSPDEVAAFEQEMVADAALRAAVQEQYITMQGLFQAKARQQVVRAGRQYHSKKMWTRIGFTTAIVVAAVGAVLYFTKTNNNANAPDAYSGNMLPALNEAGKAQWATADSMLPAQVFTIATASDTVVETAGGIVFSIPAGAFVDSAGKAVSGAVSVCIKEALDAQSIITAGLSTTADGKLLETGGMFFIDARQGNSILKINPALPVYAQVTGSAPKEGMQLFSGQRMPGGGINWVTPQPLPKELIAVDIKALDFFPPGYMEVLKKHGYPTGERHFTDSVYYSMTADFVRDQTSTDRSLIYDTAYHVNNSDTAISVRRSPQKGTTKDSSGACGINPAKVEAIHNQKFANTLLATREFETRMKLIHFTFSPAILDIYVNHLDKNLYELDSMAADVESSRAQDFRQLAALHCGKVRNGLKQTDKLRDYYAMQTKMLTASITVAAGKVRQQEDSMNMASEQKHTAHAQADNEQIAKSFNEEVALNLESAYRQMGYQKPAVNTTTTAGNIPVAAGFYNYPKIPAGAMNPGCGTLVAVINTGWCNIDRYTMVATQTRTTQTYTTAGTDKKAVITYNPFSVSIADAKSYDRLRVYLLPDKLSSYMKLTDSNGLYKESLNGLMSYGLLCVGIKGGQQSIISIANVTPKNYDGLVLKQASATEVQRLLTKLRPNDPTALNREVAYTIWDLQERRRQQLQRQWKVLYDDLIYLIYPCSAGTQVSTDTVKASTGTTEVKRTYK